MQFSSFSSKFKIEAQTSDMPPSFCVIGHENRPHENDKNGGTIVCRHALEWQIHIKETSL